MVGKAADAAITLLQVSARLPESWFTAFRFTCSSSWWKLHFTVNDRNKKSAWKTQFAPFWTCEMTWLDMWCDPFKLFILQLLLSLTLLLSFQESVFYSFVVTFSLMLYIQTFLHFSWLSFTFFPVFWASFLPLLLSSVVGGILVHHCIPFMCSFAYCVTVQEGSWFCTLYGV